jgi:hypothetical protein
MQTTTEHMLASTPNRAGMDGSLMAACLDACATCEIACRSCADACMGEREVSILRRCIRLDLDCAALCAATIDVGSRLYEADGSVQIVLVELCARACGLCAAECERHAHHEHCRACAEACRACEAACRKFVAS